MFLRLLLGVPFIGDIDVLHAVFVALLPDGHLGHICAGASTVGARFDDITGVWVGEWDCAGESCGGDDHESEFGE